MKKIFLTITIFILTILSACTNQNSTTTLTTTDNQTTTTTTNENTTTTTQTTTTTIDEDIQDCGNPQKGEYYIVWCDEFNYNGKPDPTKWIHEIGGFGWGNNELQYYTNREENATVGGGYLTIAAQKEDFYGSQYTSARLITRGKADFLYGRVEFRAKLPEGRGTWPALWMLPTDNLYGGWPSSGEIDVMEHVGYEKGMVHGTIHSASYNHKLGTQVGGSIYVSDATEEFHEYAVEWTPRELRFFVDDYEYFVYRFDDELDGGIDYYKGWPFDQRFFLIMNIAIGGNWGGAQGIDPDLNYAEMLVDYVRVYQKDFTTDDTVRPTAPQLRPEENEITAQSATFTWYPSADNHYVKDYLIYLNDELIDTIFSAKYNLTGLTPETTYNVKIKARDFAGNTSDASSFDITTETLDEVPGRIEAENYIVISNGRTIASSEDDTEIVVGFKDYDYLLYGFNVLEEGNYQLKLRLSSLAGVNAFRVYMSDSSGELIKYIGKTDIDSTGGFDKWATVTANQTIHLTEGVNYIKIYAVSSSQGDVFWLNWLELVKVTE